MRRKAAIGGAVAALTIAGTAVAAPGGPAGILGGDDQQREFAADLAAQLDGVQTGEVQRALETVAEQHRSEMRAEMAQAIASNLDGVSADRVERALVAAEDRAREAFELGKPPERGELAATVAGELGLSEQEVSQALEAAHEELGGPGMGEAGPPPLAPPGEAGPGFGGPPPPPPVGPFGESGQAG